MNRMGAIALTAAGDGVAARPALAVALLPAVRPPPAGRALRVAVHPPPARLAIALPAGRVAPRPVPALAAVLASRPVSPRPACSYNQTENNPTSSSDCFGTIFVEDKN